MRQFIRTATVLSLLGLCLSPAGWATQKKQKNSKDDQNQSGAPSLQQEQKPGEQPADATGPKVSKEELAAYKAFYDARNSDPSQVIASGEAFVAKYPMSVYAGAVYSELTSAYLHSNQPDKMIEAGNKALEANPDNIDVLPIMAWAIPRRVSAKTPDAGQQLAKAQGYSKHGIELLNAMAKPETMDQAAFDKAKNEKLSMCYDGLGVTDVKTGKYDQAIPELTQSVQLSSTPDPVDYYLLGLSDELTSQLTDAIAAFQKCSDNGPMQVQCKSGIEETKNKAKTGLEAPK